MEQEWVRQHYLPEPCEVAQNNYLRRAVKVVVKINDDKYYVIMRSKQRNTTWGKATSSKLSVKKTMSHTCSFAADVEMQFFRREDDAFMSVGTVVISEPPVSNNSSGAAAPFPVEDSDFIDIESMDAVCERRPSSAMAEAASSLVFMHDNDSYLNK
jgi:hypothetical protein